jgi:hypothetical protein
LNYFFLRTVNLRIVQYHGLTKYAPLVRFNARLMVLSIAMDVRPHRSCASFFQKSNSLLLIEHLHQPQWAWACSNNNIDNASAM